MKPLGFAALGSVLLAACTVAPPQPVAGPVPVVPGSASSFTPLVGASSTAPRCVQPERAPLDEGARAVAVRYASAPERQVTVTVNADGEPIKYLDVRGDLSESDGEAADRTTIGLFLDQGYAVLSNREGAGPPDMLEVTLDDVLTSPSLGNPTAVMEQVLAKCSEAM